MKKVNKERQMNARNDYCVRYKISHEERRTGIERALPEKEFKTVVLWLRNRFQEKNRKRAASLGSLLCWDDKE